MSTGPLTQGSTLSLGHRATSVGIRLLTNVREQPIPFLLVLGSLALFLSSYTSTLSSLIQRWNTDPNYSHGYLVPLVSLYLLHQSLERSSRRELSSPQGGHGVGSILVVAAILLLWLTTLVPSLVLESFSMLVMILGAISILFGRSLATRSIAPVAFLLFMVPWPSKLYSQAAFPLQLAISQTASVLLTMLGIPVLCDGSLIHLPGQTMHVAEACSGMRQLTAFLAMGAATALMIERPTWVRGIILASAVPVAVLVNILRVTLMALMHHAGLGEWTKGTLHTLEGMIMIFAGFGILMGIMRVLDWIQVEPDPHPKTFDARVTA
ncbi:exosortase/archaeosortase family protein [bacterium]|nr:exosortase/archaeosortase family protein [bacterium]